MELRGQQPICLDGVTNPLELTFKQAVASPCKGFDQKSGKKNPPSLPGRQMLEAVQEPTTN